MRFLYGLGGANVPVIKEYEMEYPNFAIEAGEVVRCNNAGRVTQNILDATLGVAVENHTAKKDILNQRNNGKMIRVNITKDAVYRTDAPRLIVSKTGTTNTVYTKTEDLSSTLVDCLLVLVEKGEGSQNTDEIGCARAATAYSSGADNAITVAEGGISYEGDVYAIMPQVGNEYNVSEDNITISYGPGNGGAVKIVGRDIVNATIDVVLKETIFD